MHFWLNIDFPTADAKLHRSTCDWVLKASETAYKGVGALRRDGGWLRFDSRSEAERYIEAELGDRRVRLSVCQDCR